MRAILSIIVVLKQRFNRSQDGFLLIEVAIVLAIMATIISFALPILTQHQSSQRTLRTHKNIELLEQVLGQYFLIHRCLPCPVPSSSQGTQDHGLAPKNCLDPLQVSGTIPYRTLGISYQETLDGHRHPIRYTVDYYFTEPNFYEKLDETYQNKFFIRDQNDQDLTDKYKNPVIYILVAINDAVTDISPREAINTDQSLTFYNLPYSIDITKPFRHTVKWMTINTLIACYGNKLLVIQPLTKETSKPLKIPDNKESLKSPPSSFIAEQNMAEPPKSAQPVMNSTNSNQDLTPDELPRQEDFQIFSEADYEDPDKW